MIYYVYLVALAAGALADPAQPNSDKNTQTGDYTPMSDICFFGFPSFSCSDKCEKLGQEEYCDHNTCLCRPKQTQEHHETQQEAPVPTTAPAASTTLPGHKADAPVAAAKPTATPEEPIKCFMGSRPIACERRCNQRGLQSSCETRLDGQFCVCVARKDNLSPPNTNTALSLLPSSEDTPLSCFLGRKPLMCVLRCQQRDQDSYCNELNLCVCNSENHLLDIEVSFNDDFDDESDDDEEEEQESSPNVFMYFMKWTKLFGDNNDTEPTTAPNSEPQAPPSRVYYVHEQTWSYEYLLTLLVLGLLCLLISMELLTCYRRKRNRSKVDTIFQAMPTNPNKS